MTVSALAPTTTTDNNFGITTMGDLARRLAMTMLPLVAGAVYAVVSTSVPMNESFTYLPTRIAVVFLVMALAIAALRKQVEPALWGIGYVAGLAVIMAAGAYFYGDSHFLGYIYTGGAAIIAFVIGVQWLEDRARRSL
jgi:hypothetical protein